VDALSRCIVLQLLGEPPLAGLEQGSDLLLLKAFAQKAFYERHP
jgi:hypothetical protein